MTSTPMLKSRTGSCLCKMVKYTVSGEPQAFRVCHCISCKKFTGSAFMTSTFFTSKQITIHQGEDSLKAFQDNGTASGHPLERIFCTTCGSNVFMKPLHPLSVSKDIRIVCGGTFDEDPGWTPTAEIFRDHRAAYITVESMPKSKPKSKL